LGAKEVRPRVEGKASGDGKSLAKSEKAIEGHRQFKAKAGRLGLFKKGNNSEK